MVVEFVAVVMDARSPGVLARFWARALRWPVDATPSGEVALLPTDPTSVRLEIPGGAAAKVARSPTHFDLTSTSGEDQRSSVTDLIAHGASPAGVGQTSDEDHVALADPEGSAFCLVDRLDPTRRAESA